MDFAPLTEREESIAERIVDAAYTVHKKLKGLFYKFSVLVASWLLIFDITRSSKRRILW